MYELMSFLRKALGVLLVILMFFGLLYCFGSFRDPKADIRDLSMDTNTYGDLSGQQLIDAAKVASRKAENAVYLYDLLPGGTTDLIVENSNGKPYDQLLRLCCWGAHTPFDAKIAGAEVALGNRYENFHVIIAPRMNDGHEVLLTIRGDSLILYQRTITAQTQPFQLKLDVRGIHTFSLQIESDDYASRNPGIYLKNAFFD